MLNATQQRTAREAALRDRYRRGELSIDVHEMRGRLADAGLTYVDSLDTLS